MADEVTPSEWAMEKARVCLGPMDKVWIPNTPDACVCWNEVVSNRIALTLVDADAAGYERGVREEREWIDAVADAIEADGCDAAALVIALRLHAGGQDPYDARGAQPKHEQAAEES